MAKNKNNRYRININDCKNDPKFYEELALLSAQETIAELMEKQNISKTNLAGRLNKSKAHVTNLLANGRNLTLRSFARVCFHLNASIKEFKTSPLTISSLNNKSYIYERKEESGNWRQPLYYKRTNKIRNKKREQMRKDISFYTEKNSYSKQQFYSHSDNPFNAA